MPVQCICVQCGSAFSAKPAHIASGKAQRCSNTCRAAAIITTVDRTCEYCGAVFKIRPSRIREGGGRFCSRLCARKATRPGLTHGETTTGQPSPEYRVWTDMKARCLSPNHPAFSHYGGRGITICERWRESFEAFLSDVGRRPTLAHSLDRIDNDGHYEPGNIRWATWDEQARNKRSNRLMTFNGMTQCVQDWARTTGLPASALYGRVYAGWSAECTLTTPLLRLRRKKP